MVHPGSHRKVGEGGRERVTERVRERTCGSAFIGIKGGVLRVLRFHSLLVNLKHKGGN